MHAFSCNQVKSTSEITWGACGAVATLQKSSSDDRDMEFDVALALQEFRRCAAHCAPAPHCRISLSAKQGRVRTTCDDAGGEVNELQSVGLFWGHRHPTQKGPTCEPNVGKKTEYT
jgi:hypothetical protein